MTTEITYNVGDLVTVSGFAEDGPRPGTVVAIKGQRCLVEMDEPLPGMKGARQAWFYSDSLSLIKAPKPEPLEEAPMHEAQEVGESDENYSEIIRTPTSEQEAPPPQDALAREFIRCKECGEALEVTGLTGKQRTGVMTAHRNSAHRGGRKKGSSAQVQPPTTNGHQRPRRIPQKESPGEISPEPVADQTVAGFGDPGTVWQVRRLVVAVEAVIVVTWGDLMALGDEDYLAAWESIGLIERMPRRSQA